MAGSAFYLIISGAAAPATRAFVMLAMILIAMLLDRPALSMRALALAAAILLLLRPEAITEPGFQMSFAAVAGLIAVAEWEMTRERKPRAARQVFAPFRGIVMTSLVGSLATMPFALFHFDRATHYAVLGNLIAMPVMGLWVMPAAALSVALMPFGLEAGALHLLGQGIAVMVALGRWVSGASPARDAGAGLARGGAGADGAGRLWLAIWRRGWRWWGVLPMALGRGAGVYRALARHAGGRRRRNHRHSRR